MKRRAFLWAGIGAAASLAAWQYLTCSDEDIIAMVVRKRLDYLRLDPDGVRRFAHDIAARQVVSRTRIHVLSELVPLYRRFALSSGNSVLANKLRHGEDRIVGSYLISSDFFINGADESREIKYLGMIDARRACANPFAQRPA